MFEKLFNKVKTEYHHTSTDWVFEEEETGAGHKVWFRKAHVETHEDTGKKRVRLYTKTGPKFYDETQWNLATALSDRSDYETVVMRGLGKPTFPKNEYINKVSDIQRV